MTQPHKIRSSASRRSSTSRAKLPTSSSTFMTCYCDLPAEVRQWILYLSIPNSDDVTRPWLTTLHCLMLISKQSFNDVREVLSILKWSLRYTIRKNVPPALPTEQFRGQLCILPPPKTLCVCTFYDVNYDDVRMSTVSAWIDHGPRLEKWADSLSELLTKETETVLVDATPAPGYIRRHPPSHTASFVTHTRVTRWLLDVHHRAIVDFFQRLASICGDKTDLFLVGTYADRSRRWVHGIVEACARVGVQIHVRVDYVQRKPIGPSLLQQVTCKIQPSGDTSTVPSLWAWNAERRMRDTNWRASTGTLYEECVAMNAEWASYALDRVTCFVADAALQTLDLKPAPNRERRLAHRLIEDVGFWSESVGNEPDRYVRFSRDRLRRPWEQDAEIPDGERQPSVLGFAGQ